LDKARWSWPFGRVVLQADNLRAYTPIFLGRFQLHIPFSGISGATTKGTRFGGRIRLIRRDGIGDVTIVTLKDGYLQIGDVLRAKGVDLDDG
jgi:hypothetical protein